MTWIRNWNEGAIVSVAMLMTVRHEAARKMRVRPLGADLQG